MATVLTNVDNPFNQQFGNPNERVANKVKDVLPESVKAFIAIAFYRDGHEQP